MYSNGIYGIYGIYERDLRYMRSISYCNNKLYGLYGLYAKQPQSNDLCDSPDLCVYAFHVGVVGEETITRSVIMTSRIT